ncbi:MAG: hypothetical protein M1294_06625, partial [Firmicutes bacterium]|nr:hypothetical protein [Bacillota bacterium]
RPVTRRFIDNGDNFFAIACYPKIMYTDIAPANGALGPTSSRTTDSPDAPVRGRALMDRHHDRKFRTPDESVRYVSAVEDQ